MEVRNWGTELVTHPKKYKEVLTVEDIVDVVTNPDEYPSPVRALGSRHSVANCIEADGGTVLDMRKLNAINEPDEENLTITVGSGARYYDISHFLQARGLMNYINTEIGNVTAGAAVVGHTKDSAFPGEYGQVSSYVVGVKMVTADGKKLEVTEKNDPELMRFVRLSYGLLGVVYEVTFKITPLRLMRLFHKVYSLEEFLDQLDELRESGCSIMYYMIPLSNKVIVEFRKYVETEDMGKPEGKAAHPTNNKHLLPYGSDWQFTLRNIAWAKVGPFMGWVAQSAPSPLQDIVYRLNDAVLLGLVATLAGYRILPAEQTILYGEQPLPATKYTFSMTSFPVTNIKKTMREYFDFIHSYYKRTGWRCTLVDVGYRIFQDDKSYLSYCRDGEAMTLDPVTNADDGWYPYLKEYNEFCAKRGGRPLLNQTPVLTRGYVSRTYRGQLDEFNNTYRRQMDPNNRFLNVYLKDLMDF